MRPEAHDHGHIGRVATAGHDDAADARDVVAGIERLPAPADIDLDPGAEIHRVDDRHADVAQVSVDVAGRDVHAAAERDGEMGEVPAHADPFLEGLVGRAGRAGLLVVELDVPVDEVADGLDAGPAGCRRPEQIPSRLAEPIRLAITAAEEVDEALVGQGGDGALFGVRKYGVVGAAVPYRRVTPEDELAGRRDEAAAEVAVKVVVGRGGHVRRRGGDFRPNEVLQAIGLNREHADDRGRLRALKRDFVSIAYQHRRFRSSSAALAPRTP